MKILRKIIVISSVTEGNQVERYICDKCGKKIRDISIVEKYRNRKKYLYSKLIYIDKCDKCKRIKK